METTQIADALKEISAALSADKGGLLNPAILGTIIGALTSVVILVINQIMSKKRLRHDVTLKCIKDYWDILGDGQITIGNVKHYLGFMNEELFYIEKKLISEDLEKEWLENLIHTLPLFYREGTEYKVYNQNVLTATRSIFAKKSNWAYLFPYPRLRRVLLLDKIPEKLHVTNNIKKGYENFDQNNEIKKQIVEKMLKNLRNPEKIIA